MLGPVVGADMNESLKKVVSTGHRQSEDIVLCLYLQGKATNEGVVYDLNE